MFLSLSLALGGLVVPEIVMVSLKLDQAVDWRWETVFVPFWILDIALIVGGIIFAELHRRKLSGGNVVDGDGPC